MQFIPSENAYPQSKPTPGAEAAPSTSPKALFNTRYQTMAANTIDYWMLPDDDGITERDVQSALQRAPVLDDATLQIYIHVPFCAQHCRFCAFSGGNSMNFRQAQRYSRLVVDQLHGMLDLVAIKGHSIRSINIGGGSPDLLNDHIGHVLQAVRDLPGCTDQTELSVEFTLSTTKPEFIEQLVHYEVTKVSFGIQSVDRQVRAHMRQPQSLQNFEQVLGWIDGRIPIVNADLITGLPGQDLATVASDLSAMMSDPRIHGISSYLLTPGAAPSLMAGLLDGELPPQAPPAEQARMRLHTYSTFQRAGWVRRGTNTYLDPNRIDPQIIDRIAGNECIGTRRYEDFLLGVGPQAVSYAPGVRAENRTDIDAWCAGIEQGEHPYHLPKCSTTLQTDTGLWVFPLRWEALPQSCFDRMMADGAISDQQLSTLAAFVREGLIVHTAAGYELSILGEVFMGHLVHDLKKDDGRRAVEEYIAEGNALGRAISAGTVQDQNSANNRQIALPLLQVGSKPNA